MRHLQPRMWPPPHPPHLHIWGALSGAHRPSRHGAGASWGQAGLRGAVGAVSLAVPSSPDAFPCLPLRSLAFFFFFFFRDKQLAAALSHHITSGPCVTARSLLLSLLFSSLRHLPSFLPLPFVLVCLSGLGLGLLSYPEPLSLGPGLSPRIVQTSLYLTSVPLGEVLSPSP